MNKSKAIITTILLALMSAIILVTASVALFSKSVTVENYLQAGTLEVGLARTSLRGQIPDADGVLQQETTSSDRVDLTAAQTDDENDSVFTFGTSGVPGMWQEATLEIENRGNVAFDYSVAFFFTSTPEAGSAEERLAGKLLVTVTDAQGNVLTDAGTTLADGVYRNNGGRVLGVTAVGKSLRDALSTAYQAVGQIGFVGSFYRRDIGQKVL